MIPFHVTARLFWPTTFVVDSTLQVALNHAATVMRIHVDIDPWFQLNVPRLQPGDIARSLTWNYGGDAAE
jgi:hypothetical protein